MYIPIVFWNNRLGNIFHDTLAPQKCFCENSNGGSTRNSILCGNGKIVNKVDECASDEWCAGAENVDEGLDTIDYKSLCIKGKIISNIVRSLWLLYKVFITNIFNQSLTLILIEQVSCGNGYHAPSCSQCTFTENWCNGECEFDWDENKCKEKGIIIYLRIKIQQQNYVQNDQFWSVEIIFHCCAILSHLFEARLCCTKT